MNDINTRAADLVKAIESEPLFAGLEARVWSPKPGLCRVYINKPADIPSRRRLGFIAVCEDGTFEDNLNAEFWCWGTTNAALIARREAMEALLGLD